MKGLIAGLVLAAFFCQRSPGASVESTFDDGTDGWSVQNAPSSWSSTGGNPGGYLRAGDMGEAGTRLVAPTKFRGDLSPYNGGLLSLDLRAIAQPGAGGQPWSAQISSSNISASRVIDEFPYSPAWESYNLPLVASEWGTTESEWQALLSNVLDIRLTLDATESSADVVGLDNFRLTQIPEPSTICLAAVALLLVLPFKKCTVHAPRGAVQKGS